MAAHVVAPAPPPRQGRLAASPRRVAGGYRPPACLGRSGQGSPRPGQSQSTGSSGATRLRVMASKAYRGTASTARVARSRLPSPAASKASRMVVRGVSSPTTTTAGKPASSAYGACCAFQIRCKARSESAAWFWGGVRSMPVLTACGVKIGKTPCDARLSTSAPASSMPTGTRVAAPIRS